jgi:hypothetical protein
MTLTERQTRKLNLISKITDLTDDSLIEKIESFLNQNTEIPEWQKKELDGRRSAYLKNPNTLLNADKVFEELDKEFS